MKNTLPSSPVKFICFFLKAYFWRFLFFLFMPLLWATQSSLEPYIIKIVLDILEENSMGGELLIKFKQPILIYVVLRVVMNFANRLHDYNVLKFLPHLNKRILIRITKYIQKHSHSYFQHHFGGSLVSKMSIIAETTEAILNDFIYYIVFPCFSLLFITVTMGTVHAYFAFILVLWAIVFISISYYLSCQLQSLSEQYSEKHTTLLGKLIDSITNILAVRLFSRRKYEIKFLETAAQEKVKKAEALRLKDLKRNTIMEIMANALIIIIIYYLILERQSGKITIGDFALILTLSLSIIDILWDISHNYIHLAENIGKCAVGLQTIIISHEIKDDPSANPLTVTHGSIEFKNVTFSYNGRNPMFKNLSIKINPNEKVGIIGFSGSGKTTFVNLIVRLFDVDSGSILIDGQDIRNVTQDSLHNNINFISQDPLLFHRTVKENIQYGNLNASEAEIMEAAKKAHADQFIAALPKGYDTLIGERGSTLSGGQRQRLAIARAHLKNTKILILDEATSALDSETEHYIQKSLDDLMQNKTVLVVAHRLSTLLRMDRIIVFDQGVIVEEGNHQFLLHKRGQYAKFWNMQQRINQS